MANRLRMANRVRAASPPPISQVSRVAAPAAQPGHIQGMTLQARKTAAHPFHRRQNPVIADSPVARVQRSISMLMKYWVVTPTMQAQKATNPKR